MIQAPKEPVEIVDLTVEDLKDYEDKLDHEQGVIAIALGDGTIHQKAPKSKGKAAGGRIQFGKPDPTWKTAKTWEFIHIQALVNLLITTYEIEVVPVGQADKLRRADNCAVKLGFFTRSCHSNKAHMDAHTKTWLPKHLQNTFIDYMSMLEAILSPTVIDEALVRKNYKLAKSAIVGHFPPAASATLNRGVRDVVQKDVDRMRAEKKRAAAGKKKG